MSQSRQLPEGAIPVLNDGFVALMDHMGNDRSIVQAARISYGKDDRKIGEKQRDKDGNIGNFCGTFENIADRDWET